MTPMATGRSVAHLTTELRERLSPHAIVRANEPLARRTTLRVGGPVDLYVEPALESDLAATFAYCQERSIPFFVLGRGSNLLVRDGGFRGVAICLVHPRFSGVAVAGDRLECGAGARLKAVANAARDASLAGLEFLEGIPGSVGGALRMNAGAMGGAIFDLVVSVRTMAFDGAILERGPAEMAAAYRCCTALKDQVALGAVLQGRPGSREDIEERMREFSRKRWSSQPAAPSAGCMFKNPVTVAAGRLIDELGLKGTRVGGAMVSREHGNFLVNDGSATARDVCALIDLVRQRALERRAIELETEVEVIGEDA